jgi:CBS domain-containing protein
MQVRDVMSDEPVFVDHDGTLRDAVQEMTTHRVGSVVVFDKQHRSERGILTKSDVLDAAYRTDRPLSQLSVADELSAIVTVAPDVSVQHALQKMRTEGVRHLVVTEGSGIVGVVTASDVAFHAPDAVDAVAEPGSGKRRSWFG